MPNGDAEMLEIARLALLIDHDDAEREFSYREGAEKVLAEARLYGWTIVSVPARPRSTPCTCDRSRTGTVSCALCERPARQGSA